MKRNLGSEYRRPTARVLLKTLTAFLIGLGLIAVGALAWRRAFPDRSLVRAWESAGAQQWAHVVTELEPYLRTHPQDIEAISLLARAYAELGEYLASAVQWERIPHDSPHKRSALVEQGVALLSANCAARAEQAWLDCLAMAGPDDHDDIFERASEELANLYWLQGRKPDIQRLIADWLDRSYRARDLSQHLKGLSWQLRVQLLDMDATEAIDSLKRFVEQDESDITSRRALGHYLASLGRYDEARVLLRGCLIQDSRDLLNWFEFFAYLIESGELDTAGKILAELPVAARDHPLFQATLGKWALAIGDETMAESAFRRVLATNRHDERALVQIVNIMRRKNQPEQLREQLDILEDTTEKLHKLQDSYTRLRQSWDPNSVESASIAHLCDALGYMHEADEWWRRAAALNPATIPNRQYPSSRLSDSKRDGLYWADAPPADRLIPAVVAGASELNDEPAIRFSEVASRAGIHFDYFRGQTGQFWIVEPNGGGAAWLDARQNGWLDLFFINGCTLLPAERNSEQEENVTLSSRFYRNNSDGTFSDCTAQAGLLTNCYGQGCTVADFDNDGFPDLYLTAYGGTSLLHNQGDGTFRDVTIQSGTSVQGFTTGSAFADLNRDGNLDLYVVTYVDFDPAVHGKPCYNSATDDPEYCGPRCCPGRPDILLMGRGDGSFQDVTNETVVAEQAMPGFAVVAADLNNDGWPDLYVANDGQPNTLLLNVSQGVADGRIQFHSSALEQGCALDADGIAQASMGVACGDIDADGRLDLGVTNYYYEHFTLYRNLGNAGFDDASSSYQLVGATRTSMGWGTNFIDFDNDGWLDLFITNGHINRTRDGKTPYEMAPQLFRNSQRGRFVDVSRRAGPYFQGRYVGRGAAFGDYDNDGFEDIAVVHHHSTAALLHNETATNRTALVIKLIGRMSSRDAWNARVVATVRNKSSDSPVELMREITSGTSYLSGNDIRVRFGIDQSAEVDVRVQWPSGHSQSWHNLRSGGTKVLRELESGVVVLP